MPTPDALPAGRLTDYLDQGVLAACYPRDQIEDVLVYTGTTEVRRRKLPAHVVVRHAIAWGLNATQGTDAAMRDLVGCLQWLGSWEQDWKVPSTSAIAQARAKLGWEPLAELFHRACTPMADATTPGAFAATRRLMSIDGTTVDVADTDANTDYFGHSGKGRNRSAFPQLRLFTLSESGTRAIVGAAMGPCSTGERTLAHQLGRLCDPGMLVLADAGLYSWQLWTDYASTGADLAWRVGAGVELPPVRALDDGSYLALVFSPLVKSRKAKDALLAQARAGHQVDPERALVVRAVDYTVPEANPEGELITVMTTVLDPGQLSAVELADLYARRWEHETALDEVKNGQLGAHTVIASQSPAMVTAQVWGLLLAHYAVRELMYRSAEQVGLAPDRMGFTHSVRIVRRTALGGTAFSP